MHVDHERRQNIPIKAFGCVILICMSLVPGYLLAQEHPAGASLELTLEVGKTQVALGEPVYVTVHLINAGATPVEVLKVLDPQTGAVQVEVSSTSRPRLVFLPLFYADAIDARKRLGPGEEVAAVFPIFYGGLGWTFRQPETYSISANYRDSAQRPREPLRSNRVTVGVAEESGAGTFLMSDTVAGDEAGKFLLWQRGDHLHAGLAHLTNLLNTFPDSPVTDYALLALGRNLSRGFRNYSIGQVRQPDCAAALGYLQKVRTDRLPTYLQIQKNLDQARCLIKLGQQVQAREFTDQAERLGGDRIEFRPLFQQAVRLEPALRQIP